MNEINNSYTRNEVISQQALKAIAQQNAIWSDKEGKTAGIFQNQKDCDASQDSIYISQEAQMLFQQLEQMREDNKDSAKAADQQNKCMVIAMRIAAGDEVPQKDIKFLIKYNAALYAKAMQMRVPKSEPEEYDTVLDEEDEKELDKYEQGAMKADLPEGVRITEGISFAGNISISE